MPLTLYYDERSPPVRSVLMLIKMLNITVELKEVDLFKREQLRPEFLELNPAHTVPVLVDDDLTLTDSHAILIHLCEKYQGGDLQLWPKDDYKERMQVLNLLLFSCSVVFRRDSDVMSDIVRKTFPKIDLEYHQRKIHEVYDMMERYLGRNKYLASDKLTIADLSAVTTLSTVNLIFPIESTTEPKWPLLASWMQRLRQLPEYQINEKGLNIFHEVLKVYGKFDCNTSSE
ncbi:glutathione S-transferase E14-like [Musca autumnalis]|uniref:glutathione S-transferase E14-like n=1 Tax=Musca autumnalis TaxID=221902 RepID=UPI003CE94984